MVVFLRVIQAVLLLAAGFNAMNVWAAKQVAFAQVCEMLTVVSLLVLLSVVQRTTHRIEDAGRAKKARAAE